MLPAEPVAGCWEVNLLNLSKVAYFLTADAAQTSQIHKPL